ncbi:MAG TPA: SRPBCC family protein [Bacteroidia bacterium]|jgi:ligand-binding SRPBCC domain-containing protein|nr:SRPBCC family protein [Bacteroidia bacterium]
MTIIYLETIINAPAQVCFDLSRSIDLHQVSTVKTKERAVAGKTKGLIEKGEFVTWEAVHFGIKQNLTVTIVEMKAPEFFSDRMVKGAFKSMYHEHHFKNENGKTLMIDVFTFAAPLGFLGIMAEKLFLKNYMKKFLIERNEVIKRVAESGDWKKVLG